MIPGFDRRIALIDQRERLRERGQQAEAMIRAIDVALAAIGRRSEKDDDELGGPVPGFRPSLSVPMRVRRPWRHDRRVSRSSKTNRALHA